MSGRDRGREQLEPTVIAPALRLMPDVGRTAAKKGESSSKAVSIRRSDDNLRLLVAMCTIGATLATARAQEPQRPGNGVTLPTVVKRVHPEYTQEAMAERIEGVVGLSTVVRADGTVGDVAVTNSLDRVHGLDQQAVKAMKQWKFKPGTKDGEPVAVRVDVQMTFTLK